MKKDQNGWVRIASKLQALDRTGDLDAQGCTHIVEIQDVRPASDGCAKCIVMGDAWVSLRLCLTCGHVGCCDDSKNKHASKHYQETKHPMMVSYEVGEEWSWCYVDQVTIMPKG
jgi:uncharacterized UBP type Zn finger protein